MAEGTGEAIAEFLKAVYIVVLVLMVLVAVLGGTVVYLLVTR